MSEMGDDYRAYNEHMKAKRRARQVWQTDKMKKWCKENGVSFKEIQPYQLRAYNRTVTIDIFPQSYKYHDLKNNKRGKFKDLKKFLNDKFKNDNNPCAK